MAKLIFRGPTVPTGITTEAIFTATITGTVMTVTGITSGVITNGAQIFGTGISAGQYISSFGTGSGGTGTYNLHLTNTLGSTVISTDDNNDLAPLTIAEINQNFYNLDSDTALRALKSGDTFTGPCIFDEVNVTNITDSQSFTTGALIVAGGVGINKSLRVKSIFRLDGVGYFSNRVLVQSTLDATSATNGALWVTGGASIQKSIYVGGDAKIIGTTASTSTLTGALTVGGGLGVAGSIYGASLISSGNITANGTLNLTATAGTVISMDSMGLSGKGAKKITINDGLGDWNFRAGVYSTGGGSPVLRYETTGNSGTSTVHNFETTTASITWSLFPIAATAGDAAVADKTLTLNVNGLTLSSGSFFGNFSGTLTGAASTATTATNINGGSVNATTGNFSGAVSANRTLDATSSNSAASLRTLGGLAVAKSLWVGTTLNVPGLTTQGKTVSGDLVRVTENLAEYALNDSAVIGTIEIDLGINTAVSSNIMSSYTIEGYDYGRNTSFKVKVAGYVRTSVSSWTHSSVEIEGDRMDDLQVRLAFRVSDGHAVILLGDTARTWAYPQMILKEAFLSYNHMNNFVAATQSFTGQITNETGLYTGMTIPALNDINVGDIYGSSSTGHIIQSSGGSEASFRLNYTGGVPDLSRILSNSSSVSLYSTTDTSYIWSYSKTTKNLSLYGGGVLGLQVHNTGATVLGNLQAKLHSSLSTIVGNTNTSKASKAVRVYQVAPNGANLVNYQPRLGFEMDFGVGQTALASLTLESDGTMAVNDANGILYADFKAKTLTLSGNSTTVGAATINGKLHVTNVADATSSTSAASMRSSGGLAVALKIHAGTSITSPQFYGSFNGAVLGTTGSFTGQTSLTANIQSTSDTTGTLKVSGGIAATGGIWTSKGLWIEGGKHTINNNDGGGNFNVRIANRYVPTDPPTGLNECTEAGYMWHESYTQSNGTHQVLVSPTSLAIGNQVTDPNMIPLVVMRPTSITNGNATYNIIHKLWGSSTITSNLNVNGNLVVDGEITGLATLSDANLKDRIVPIESALNKVSQIRGVFHGWNETAVTEGKDGDVIEVGVIAQEVEKVLPEIVVTRENGNKAVRYDRLVPLLINAINELSEEVKKLKSGN